MQYQTNFSRGCFHHWTVSKAIMEFVQNFLDSDGEREWEFGEDYLTLTNKDIKVSNKLLMMGKSDKRDDSSKRGQFGVGSIQAMVVLTDQDIGVAIQNNGVCWSPTFAHCDKFGEDVMVINETPCNNGTNFSVTITGLSDCDIDEVKQRCLVFQDRKVLHSTQYGDIIENVDNQGEVFCGEIYVCQNKGFNYSYNFKPKGIELSQDRNAVDNWELQKLTSKLITDTNDVEFIKQAMQSNKLDTEHVNKYWGNVASTPEAVDDSFAEDFLEEHGTAIVSSCYEEHRQHQKLGNKSVYVRNESIANAIRSSVVYREAMQNVVLVEKESFSDLFDKFVELASDLIYNDATQEAKDLFDALRERVDNREFD